MNANRTPNGTPNVNAEPNANLNAPNDVKSNALFVTAAFLVPAIRIVRVHAETVDLACLSAIEWMSINAESLPLAYQYRSPVGVSSVRKPNGQVERVPERFDFRTVTRKGMFK